MSGSEGPPPAANRESGDGSCVIVNGPSDRGARQQDLSGAPEQHGSRNKSCEEWHPTGLAVGFRARGFEPKASRSRTRRV